MRSFPAAPRPIFLPLILSLLVASSVFADAYDPPAGYYDAATGTGSTLKSQLTSIMPTGHILRTDGNFRDSAVITDADPNTPVNILLVFNRASVSGTWDGGRRWIREHTWPDSLQPQNASNSSTGAIADPHMLRPANPSINSSRGNKPYGLDDTTGIYGAVSGGYYYPIRATRTRATCQGLRHFNSMRFSFNISMVVTKTCEFSVIILTTA